ncbi:hypothetical protein FB451DRAFT_1390479 [Mycena latifolia]|nr:hypothetical protein FB451DRAFT_1390479 [Mycena latifolia]
MLPVLQGMTQVRKWGGSLGNLFGSLVAIDLTHPFFRTITHMDLNDYLSSNGISVCARLAEMPALTHLCFHDFNNAEINLQALEQCTLLQVLVNLRHGVGIDDLTREIPPVTDMRFVVGVYRNGWNGWNEWELWARGGTDFWAAADAFIARKRRGEIAAPGKLCTPCLSLGITACASDHLIRMLDKMRLEARSQFTSHLSDYSRDGCPIGLLRTTTPNEFTGNTISRTMKARTPTIQSETQITLRGGTQTLAVAGVFRNSTVANASDRLGFPLPYARNTRAFKAPRPSPPLNTVLRHVENEVPRPAGRGVKKYEDLHFSKLFTAPATQCSDFRTQSSWTRRTLE